MRIDRVLVNLARLKALYPLKPSAHPFADGVERLSGNLIVELFDSDEPLPAIAATDPVAFGCIIGRDDVGAPAFRALKFEWFGPHRCSRRDSILLPDSHRKRQQI